MFVYIQEIYYIDNIMPGPKKFLTPRQMKFAELIVYGIEGSPITKGEAARLAGYADPNPEGTN